MAAPGWLQTPILKVPTPKSIRISRATPKGCVGCTANPAPQWLQDRQSDHPRTVGPRRALQSSQRLRHEPLLVEGSEPREMHQTMAHAFDVALDRIREIQADARREGSQVRRPCWPLIVLRSPKGWTGPRDMDGKRVE